MQMQLNDNVKKGLSIAVRILALIVVVFSVAMMVFTIFSVSTVNSEKGRTVFGYKFFIVLTGSMSPSEKNAHLDVHFSEGDIIIVKDLDDDEKKQLSAGDIITFVSANEETWGKTISHMIRSVIKDDDGNVIAYKTFGTNTDTDDEVPVEWHQVEGVYSSKLPKLGNFFNFVKSTQGYIICIFVPFALLILYNGVNCIRLFKKYKREQNKVLEDEKAEIAAERQQNADMMKELLALKAELERKQAEANAAQTATLPDATPETESVSSESVSSESDN